MSNPAFSFNINFVQETCISCGCPFGMPTALESQRRNDHKMFYCPNGHGQYYSHESAAEKNARLLNEEQARHRRTLERANEAEREAERLKKRVARGACPCCKRSFVNLRRHINTKHPNYGK